ncbi:MAG: hypothetical protein HY554_12335 [Elusimicrobia bacterium]|nr:hypothetical protein [Elusimicrobiota bacterium]
MRQVPGDRRRRFFSDKSFELLVWYEPDGGVFGFQLMYAMPEKPYRAIAWTSLEGYGHHFVSLSEGAALGWNAGRGLSPARLETFDKHAVLELFEKASEELEPSLRALLREKLAQVPGELPRCPLCPERRAGYWRCCVCQRAACAECLAERSLRQEECEKGAGDRHYWVRIV